MHFLGIAYNYAFLFTQKLIKYIIFYLITISSMCYLKKFQRISAVPVSKISILEDTDAYSSDQSVFQTKFDDTNFGIEKIQTSQKKGIQNEMFMNLFSLLSYNSALMNSLETKINKNNEALDSLNTEVIQKPQGCESISSIETQNSESSQVSEKSGHFSDQALTQKLFGKKSYKYKLKLASQFSDIIYKERNISFTLTLVNAEGQSVRNSNVVNLCLGVCDYNGEWIAQTRNAQNFMKGKTEAELYHGESNYSKIYPRDVSRSYEGGKVNFVVYPKPSMLHYSGNTSSLESKVNFDEIEPLIIKDLTIRAKKKE